jgi:hypothetical protein
MARSLAFITSIHSIISTISTMKINSISRKQVIEAVDPTNLSSCDLAVLKKKDPFMYYSIPGNRDKRLPGEEIDLSELDLAPDCSGDLARSFTAGTVKKEHKVAETTPRRHSSSLSGSIKRRESGSEVETGATFEFELQCPSFTIQEEEKIFSADASRNRRFSVESDRDSSKLVHRKSAISFESYVDDVLDDAIKELSYLQPKRPSVQIDTKRRGSVLQDLLFSSIASIGDSSDYDSDFD